MIRFLCALALLLSSISIHGQDNNKNFTVKRVPANVVITPDGILDETIWESAESAHDFWEYFPIDSIQAPHQSDIKMLYDDKFLYIGITVHTAGRDYRVQTLKRDFRAGDSDNITLLFDTFNDGTNAFLFGINPLGYAVKDWFQVEVTIFGGLPFHGMPNGKGTQKCTMITIHLNSLFP